MRIRWCAVLAAVAGITAWAGPLRAAQADVAIEAVTWVWTGPTQHPLAQQAPDRQLVSFDQASATKAVALIRLTGGAHSNVTLTVPATTDPLDGAVDAQGTAAVWACPVLTGWDVGEPGRPAGDVRWDCELGADKGVAEAAGDRVNWTFHIPEIGEHGVALAPASRTGAYAIPFVGADAVAVTSLALPGAVPKATDAVGSGSGGDTTATEELADLMVPLSLPPLDAEAVAAGEAPAARTAGGRTQPREGAGSGAPSSSNPATGMTTAAAQVGDDRGRTVPAGVWLAALGLLAIVAATVAELRPRRSTTHDEEPQ